jgi:heme-degrading monooxygenase HmoA
MSVASVFPKPYYAVVFSSQRNFRDQDDYGRMAEKMIELAKVQNGFLGVESARGSDGFGITVSYWKSEEDIHAWKKDGEHRLAQELGRSQWYESFVTRVCKVERDYGHSKSQEASI